MELTLRHAALLVVVAWSAAAGCVDAPKHELGAAPPAGEGGSPVSLDSALALFRVGLASLTELESAQASSDGVVSRFVDVIERSDTAGLRALVMSRREFAWLYYPASPFTRAPTKQEPGLAWFLHIHNSQKGATRLLNRYGGRPLRVLENVCKGPARIEGNNRIWDDCVQRVLVNGDTTTVRLFGGIYERNGRLKIFSYGNDL